MRKPDEDSGDDFDAALFDRLTADLDEAQARVKALFPALDAARRQYARTRDDADSAALEALQEEVQRRHAACIEQVNAAASLLGITEEDFAALDAERAPTGMEQLPRSALTAEAISPTADLDTVLPRALEALEALLPRGWVEAESAAAARLDALLSPDGVLSLTKGLRPESELPSMHRLRQAVCMTRDYLMGHAAYDHFGGATHLPTLGQLGLHLEHLAAVGGDVAARLGKLWSGPSTGVDATFFELLTAARCAALGRDVAFIQESSESSPDLQCHDPFPLVIECKRQDPLSKYELEEEAVMRSLFVQLRALARAKGLTGVFELRLTVEAKDLDTADVCATMLRQRLAPRPERPLAYAWGSVAYRERPSRLWLREVTRAYSPTMLEQVFGWTMDLPQWDGLCCSIDNARDGSVLDVRNALGVLWSNESRAALRKRTWAPTNLFGSATKQIYGGSMGIIYVAYVEGAREEAADLRVRAYSDRLADWEHAGDIRVPISVLCRLYPRPLGEGTPDLIESGVRLLSAAYGDAALFDDFPTTILTCSPRD